MAEVVGGEGQAVAAELLGHPPPHLLEGGAGEVGADLGQGGGVRAEALQIEPFHPAGLKRPHLVLAGFADRQHPDHPVAPGCQGGGVAEEHLVVAQAVGGHQPVGQAPAGVGDPLHQRQDLGVAGELAEAGGMEPVAAGPRIPVVRQHQSVVAGQGRQGDSALLAAAAGQGIALQHGLQQGRLEGAAAAAGLEAAQVGEVGGGPGGAAAGPAAAAAGIGEEGPLEVRQELPQGGAGARAGEGEWRRSRGTTA